MKKENLEKTNIISQTARIDGLLIADYLDSIDIPFFDQRGSIRYYGSLIRKGRKIPPFFVNVERNQWICPETRQVGQLSSLLKVIMPEMKKDLKGSEYLERHMADYYLKRMESPRSFPVVPLRYDKFKARLVKCNAIYGRMARYGLSALIVRNYCSGIVIKSPKTGAEELMLAFPCDNKEYYLFDGKVFRPLDGPSLTTFGEKRKGQTCYVYENPMDFLTLMEFQHRNHIDCVHRDDYHVIVNGRQNEEQACLFLKENPDFKEIYSFMPKNEDGQKMFKKLNDACKGTIIDWSSLYIGYGSLSDKLRCHIPQEQLSAVKQFMEERCRNANVMAQEQHGQTSKENCVSAVKKQDKEHLYGPVKTIIIEGRKSGMKV